MSNNQSNDTSKSISELMLPTDPSNEKAHMQRFFFIPMIIITLKFIGALIMLFVNNPLQLEGFDLYIYWSDIIFIPIVIFCYYTWITRKKYYPDIMVLYFILHAIVTISYFFSEHDVGIDVFGLVMSIIFILVFTKNERLRSIFK